MPTGPEEGLKHFRPVPACRRRRGGGLAPGLVLVIIVHSGDNLFLAGLKIDLGGREVGMPQHPLHIRQREVRVSDHAVGSSVAEVV